MSLDFIKKARARKRTVIRNKKKKSMPNAGGDGFFEDLETEETIMKDVPKFTLGDFRMSRYVNGLVRFSLNSHNHFQVTKLSNTSLNCFTELGLCA